MKKLILVCTALLSFGSFAFADHGLEVSAIPQSPILIPHGLGSTIDGGYFKLSAPYFILNSLSVTWKGKGSLEVTGVKIQGESQKQSFQCNFAGNDIKVLFPDSTVFPSRVMVMSEPLGCGGIAIANPIPTAFDIPAAVFIEGVIFDLNGNAVGKASAKANIEIR